MPWDGSKPSILGLAAQVQPLRQEWPGGVSQRRAAFRGLILWDGETFEE